MWGVRTRPASCPQIPRSYFSCCLSRLPPSCSPSIFPSSLSPWPSPSPLTPPLFDHHRHILFYIVIAEAKHNACRLHTHRSRRLTRYNRDSTATTHLPSVTPNRERATTACCTNWTLGTSLQVSQDTFRPYSCRFGYHCDRGLRPVQIPRQRVLWLVFSSTPR